MKKRFTLSDVKKMRQEDINRLSYDELKSATRAVYDALHKRQKRLEQLDVEKPIIAPLRHGLENLQKLTDTSIKGKTKGELKRMLLKGISVESLKTTQVGTVKAGNKGFESAMGISPEEYFSGGFWDVYGAVYKQLREDIELAVYSNTNIFEAIDEFTAWKQTPQTLTEFGAFLSIYGIYDVVNVIKEYLLTNASFDSILMKEKKNENTSNFLPVF